MPRHQCVMGASRSLRSSSRALRFQLQSRGSLPAYRCFHETSTALKEPSPSSSPIPTPKVPESADPIQKFASKLRQQAVTLTEPYAAYGTTEALVKTCARAGDYTATPPISPSSASDPLSPSDGAASPSAISVLAAGTAAKSAPPPSGAPAKTSTGEEVYYPASASTWHSHYALTPSFGTWAHITILHLWLALLRIRQFEPAHAKRWEQSALDHFFFAAEERMEAVHGMTSKGIRARFLKDLFDQYRGAVVSYDEGVLKGDAVLAAALWRNLFQGRQDVDAVHLAEVVAWARTCGAKLGRLGDAEFGMARWQFGNPWDKRGKVLEESLGIKAGIGEEAGAEIKGITG